MVGNFSGVIFPAPRPFLGGVPTPTSHLRVTTPPGIYNWHCTHYATAFGKSMKIPVFFVKIVRNQGYASSILVTFCPFIIKKRQNGWPICCGGLKGLNQVLLKKTFFDRKICVEKSSMNSWIQRWQHKILEISVKIKNRIHSQLSQMV